MDPIYDESRAMALPDSHGAMPQQWNIYNFYATPAKNDPWVPPGVIQAPLASDPTGHDAHLASQPGFLDYRSIGSPSECATLPGDSGYGSSRQAYSIASASVHGGDDAALDLNMGQSMTECRIGSAAHSFETPNHPQASAKYRCQDCNSWLRSQGELKKHRQRHVKPHKCPYSGCSKAQGGFSTSNDLVRHKRSVHGEHTLPGRSFICPHCTPGGKGPKIWPRADNFRSHLLRTHHVRLGPDDDHKDYLYHPPAPRNDLEGVASVGFVDPRTRPMYLQESPILSEQPSAMDSQLREDQLAPSQEPPAAMDPSPFHRLAETVGQAGSTVPSAGGGETQYIHPGVLSRPLEGPTEEDSAGAYATMPHRSGYAAHFQSHSHEYFPGDAGAGGCAPASSPNDGKPAAEPMTNASCESRKPDASGSSESTQLGLHDLSADMANSQQPLPGPDVKENPGPMRGPAPAMKRRPSQVVEYLRRFPKALLQTALEGGGQGPQGQVRLDDGSSSRTRLECLDPGCAKIFSRPCELRKHMKRHEKPYGCTFKSCSKRFGSKNDWKRHESSQHFLLETWDCDEPGCSKVCQRRESFKSHLENDHRLRSAERIDKKLEELRSGRHCDPRFWCGFCVGVVRVDTDENGGNSWTKRCDHIDNHLFGKEGLEKKSIREWIHPEGWDEETGGGPLPLVVESVPGQVGNERKRRNSIEANARLAKKPNKARTWMWTCCMCCTTMNLKTSCCCFECHHARCSPLCTVECVSGQEKDEEPNVGQDPAGGDGCDGRATL